MKSVSCVTQLSCVNPVTNVPNVAFNLSVGARLQSFWKTWLDLGAGPKVVQILKEGYTLPFPIRPKLVRFPTVISCYVNPQRNSYLLEALHQLIDKNAVEIVRNQTSLSFFNGLFLVPKPNNRWRPILDLSNLNFFLKAEKFKMETPETIRTSLQQGEWITSIDFKDAYFHIPIQEQSRKYLRFHVQGQTYQFKALPFGLSTAPLEFTVVAKEVKLMAIHKGIRIHQYLDDWLVRAGSHPSPTHSRAGTDMPKVRLASKLGKIGTGAQTNLQFCRLPVRPEGRSGPAYTGPVADPPRENLRNPVSTGLSGPAVHVPDWSTNSHRKAGLSRPASHETHTVASQKQLESAGSTGEGHSGTQIPSPSFGMVVGRTQCTSRSATASVKTRTADLYRRLKRRVGCSPWRTYRKMFLVSTRKQTSHKLSGTKSSLSSSKRVPRSLYGQNCPSGHRQYSSSSLHKQGGRYEVRPTLCPSMENLDLVYQPPGNAKSPTHPRPSKCDSGQVIQAGSNHPDRMVSPSGSFSKVVQKMALTSPICHEVQPQVTSICVSSAGLPSCSSGCPHSHLGRSGCICLPTDRHIGQSGGEIAGFPVQETHSDCTGVAQHALVLGFGDHVKSDPSQPAQHDQPVDTALQSDPSQKSDKSKSPCLAPRATAIKERGFSEAVASRVEAPQRRSTRSVYEAKWTIFTKWCITHQVDFRSPPIKSVADFLQENGRKSSDTEP